MFRKYDNKNLKVYEIHDSVTVNTVSIPDSKQTR